MSNISEALPQLATLPACIVSLVNQIDMGKCSGPHSTQRTKLSPLLVVAKTSNAYAQRVIFLLPSKVCLRRVLATRQKHKVCEEIWPRCLTFQP